MKQENLKSGLSSVSARGIMFQLADGKIGSCNTDAEWILGYTAEQLISHTSFDPFWQTLKQDGSPYTTDTHPSIVSLKTGQSHRDIVMGFYKPNGDLIWLSVNFVPLFLAKQSQPYGVEVSFRDITEQRATTVTGDKRSLAESSAASKKQLTVMLVEDSPEDREMYRRYLQTDSENRYRFIETESAEEALAMYRQHRPDIVLLDYLLPDMDGLEWLSHWQEMTDDNRPLIMLTGQGDENIAVKSLKLGAANYLVKSILTPEKLKLEVERAISDFQLNLEYREALAELQRHQQLLQLALSSSNAGSWDWEIVTGRLIWSPENYDLYGVPLQQKPLSYRDWESTLHPEDRKKTNREVKRILTGKTAEFRAEFRIIHPQRGVRWIWGLGNVTCDRNNRPVRLSGINLDISDRVASNLALEQSRYELELITEVIPQQIWTALPDGRIDYINQRWREYTGVSLQEVSGSVWQKIFHPKDLPFVNAAWNESVRTGKKYDIEARLRDAEGTYFWFLVRARPLRNKQGKIIKWYGTNTSITRIKELEEQLRHQTEDLIRANQVKDEFLAIVSHELRTPLNPILGWSKLLADGQLNAEQEAKGLETISRNARLQSQLIDDLLDMSLILRGKLELQLTPTKLEYVIDAAIETIKLTAAAKQIQIETTIEPDVGRVLGDLTRLQQIIWNLLANAVKFTPRGGRINISLERIGTQAQIRVRDTGKGIEPEFLPYVFDRFRQEESSSTRQFGGLGLGLSIVRHLSELHGGTVAAASPGKNRGATFTIKLPLIDVSTIEPSAREPNERLIQTACFQGIKVFIIEDDVDSGELLSFFLKRREADVYLLASAVEALAAFKKVTPDLLICDIGMPEVDGYSLINQIRALPQGKNIPAIALTAYAAEEDRQRCLKAGFQAHIAKPFDITELITSMTQLLETFSNGEQSKS